MTRRATKVIVLTWIATIAGAVSFSLNTALIVFEI